MAERRTLCISAPKPSRKTCARCRALNIDKILDRHPGVRRSDYKINLETTEDLSILTRLIFDVDDPPNRWACDTCKKLLRLRGQNLTFELEAVPSYDRLVMPISSKRQTWHIYWDERGSLTTRSSFGTKPLGKLGVLAQKTPVRDKSAVLAVKPFVDYGIVKRWLRNCIAQHHNCRHVFSGELFNIFLVDLRSRCVVRYPSEGRVEYVALSYVWGSTKQQSSGLGPIPAVLPRTVQDALTATVKLGYRYMWVDSLCVFDDDIHSCKEFQLGLMHKIYDGAIATLVALDNTSADDGLSRVSVSKISSKSPQVFLGNGEENSFATKLAPLTEHVRRETWSKRAWTLQESLFSNRAIFFTRDGTYYLCGAGEGNEAQPLVPSLERSSRCDRIECMLQLPLTEPHNPSWVLEKFGAEAFGPYFQLVRSYLGRRLAYQIDILNALRGVLDWLLKWKSSPEADCPFGDGFLYGLPRKRFECVLLWSTSGDLPLATLEGKALSDSKKHSRPFVPLFSRSSRLVPRSLPVYGTVIPSWSWAGWRWPKGAFTPTINFDVARQALGETPLKWLSITTVDYSEVLNFHKNHMFARPYANDPPFFEARSVNDLFQHAFSSSDLYQNSSDPWLEELNTCFSRHGNARRRSSIPRIHQNICGGSDMSRLQVLGLVLKLECHARVEFREWNCKRVFWPCNQEYVQRSGFISGEWNLTDHDPAAASPKEPDPDQYRPKMLPLTAPFDNGGGGFYHGPTIVIGQEHCSVLEPDGEYDFQTEVSEPKQYLFLVLSVSELRVLDQVAFHAIIVEESLFPPLEEDRVGRGLEMRRKGCATLKFHREKAREIGGCMMEFVLS